MAETDEADEIDGEAAQAFLNGSIRNSLGLRGEDVRVGLLLAGRDVARGAYAEALRGYAALALCEPRNADVHLGLSTCAMLMEEYGVGLQAATLAIAFAPGDPRTWLVSGRCRLGLGRPAAEARHDLAKAEALGLTARGAAVVAEARRLLAALPS